MKELYVNNLKQETYLNTRTIFLPNRTTHRRRHDPHTIYLLSAGNISMYTRCHEHIEHLPVSSQPNHDIVQDSLWVG